MILIKLFRLTFFNTMYFLILNLKNKEYVLNKTDNYFVDEYYSEVEDYFNKNNMTLVKKYKKTEEGKINVYVLTKMT